MNFGPTPYGLLRGGTMGSSFLKDGSTLHIPDHTSSNTVNRSRSKKTQVEAMSFERVERYLLNVDLSFRTDALGP